MSNTIGWGKGVRNNSIGWGNVGTNGFGSIYSRSNSGETDLAGEKKNNLLLLIGGQSNSGTDPNTGRVDYVDMPNYLQTAPTNIKWVEVVNSRFQLNQWNVDPTLQWGYLNQVLSILSTEYSEIIYSKRAIGGTTIEPDNGGTYNRTDFINKSNYAITQASTLYGNDYDILMIWNLGETNGTSKALADVFEPALIEWFSQVRNNVKDGIKIIYNKMGIYQDLAFPFIEPEIRQAQENVNLLSLNNVLTRGISQTKWKLQYLKGDISHYNSDGAISLGTNFANQILKSLGKSKTDNSKPVLLSAIISDVNTNNIVLTYDKIINPAVKPFWYEFENNTQRKVLSVEVNNTEVILEFSENFYQNEIINLTYNKSLIFESNIQDFNGNVANSFFNINVTNNSSLSQPTYTNIYTSDFSIDTNNWLSFSGGEVSRLDNFEGENNVLKINLTDSSPSPFNNTRFSFTENKKYRFRFKIYIPLSFYTNGNIISDISEIALKRLNNELIINTKEYVLVNALSDRWLSFEKIYTPTTTGNIRIQLPGVGGVVGSNYYAKDIIIDEIN